MELQTVDDGILNRRLKKINGTKTDKILKLATAAAIDVTYKGQADVIEAIAALKKQGLFFKYDVIGPGNPDILQKLIDELELNDLITIKGALTHEQVFKTLKGIDLYIQPSKQEGLPRAVVEAMSMGCPVVGSNAGGIPELISSDCIYPKGNVSMLTSLLSRVDKGFLIENAKLNFRNAKKYQSKNLEKKRKSFYREFLRDSNLLNNEQVLPTF